MERTDTEMAWVIAIAVLTADIVMKRCAAAEWANAPFVLIDGALELTYVENRGAAWGMLQGARIAFIVLTVLFLAATLFFYTRRRKELGFFSKTIIALICAGALGNLIDRAVYGYVRDMIYFSLIDFPVFNVADSAIVVGAALLILQTLLCKNGIFDVIEQHWPKKHNEKNDEH